NYLGKYNRYQRTLRDAATRHLLASDQMRDLANGLRNSKLPASNALAGVVDKYGDYRAGRAQWYGTRSQRLGEISQQKLTNTPISGCCKRTTTPVRPPKPGRFTQGRFGRLAITNSGLPAYLPTDKNDPPRVGWRKALPPQRRLSSPLADNMNRLPATA